MEVSSVIAIIQVVDRVIDLCRFYVETAKEASSDIRSILLETSILKTVLENVKFLIQQQQNVTTPGLSCLIGPNGVIETCEKTAKDLVALFPVDIVPRSRKRKRDLATSLAWPLKKAKADKLRTEICHCRANIVLAITADSAQDIKELKARTVRIEEKLTDAEKDNILKWILHTDPSSLHNRARDQYEAGTGDWVLRSPKWQAWLDGKNRCLWINGIPGSGKTVLVSRLIQELRRISKNLTAPKAVSIYYYCYFAHSQNEMSPLLRWIIHELCRQGDVIPQSVYAMFKQRHEPSFQDLERGLEECVSLFSAIFFAIDALDESQDRPSFLRGIETLATDPRFSKIRLLTTSRDYVDIERSLESFTINLPLNNDLVEDDIRRYVRAAIAKDHKFNIGRWPQSTLDMVVNLVPAKAKGMFRWAVCQLDLLRHLRPEREIIEEALKDLPETLDATYERIFNLLRKDDRPLARYALAWIHSHNITNRSKLSLRLLVQGLLRCPEVACHVKKRHLDGDTLRDICGCLIRISPGQGDNILTVSFAHYTVLEYISSGRLHQPLAYFALKPGLADEKVVSVVLKTALDPTEYGNIDKLSESVMKETSLDPSIQEISSWAFAIVTSYGRHVIRTEVLEGLAVSLLNPLLPHFQKSVNYFGHPLAAESILGLYPMRGIKWDWSVLSNPHCAHVFHIVFAVMRNSFLWPTCLPRLLKNFRVSEILRQKIRLAIPLDLADKERHLPDMWSFDGMLIEALILLACISGSPFPSRTLWPLLTQYLEKPSEDFNTTCLMSPAIFVSTYLRQVGDLADDDAVLEILLQNGDPNGVQYCVSPLQNAVRYANVVAVRLLLRAGANPNYAGNPAGIRQNIWSSTFDPTRVCGRIPLEISRRKELAAPFRPKPEAFAMVEKLLLDYGAVDLSDEDIEKTDIQVDR